MSPSSTIMSRSTQDASYRSFKTMTIRSIILLSSTLIVALLIRPRYNVNGMWLRFNPHQLSYLQHLDAYGERFSSPSPWCHFTAPSHYSSPSLDSIQVNPNLRSLSRRFCTTRFTSRQDHPIFRFESFLRQPSSHCASQSTPSKSPSRSNHDDTRARRSPSSPPIPGPVARSSVVRKMIRARPVI